MEDNTNSFEERKTNIFEVIPVVNPPAADHLVIPGVNPPAADNLHIPVVKQPVADFSYRMEMGPESSITKCHFCLSVVKTTIKYRVTSRTHMTAALCCLVCWCCCAPYCCNSAKNTDHYCPHCESYLGTYEK